MGIRKIYERDLPINPKQYIKEKIRMLEEDFMIKLTAEEKEHIKSLDTEHDIDRAALTFLQKRWFAEE